ncbi:MAG: response regulator transcription factor [Spirochaetes bacterium]|nr:response regulator transcription factor [Spirochaetota bacterium]
MGSGDIHTVFIAEDEVPARELLVDYIMARPELKLAGIARDGEDAREKLSSSFYDVVFMDIRLPHLSGIEVIQGLKKIPYLIFTTAYEQYAVRAFELEASDYLLKPFSAERFNRAVDKFLHMCVSAGRHEAAVSCSGFALRERGRHCIVPYNDIMYVSSNGKNSIIHTVDEEIETSVILKDVEDRVPADLFMRIHKQHIVNIRYIAAVQYYIGGQYFAYLSDADESPIPVGKKYASLLKVRLNLE